jgi:hypothetical protein
LFVGVGPGVEGSSRAPIREAFSNAKAKPDASAQSERSLVFDLFRFDWFVAVPKIEKGGYDYADAEAAEKEQTVGGKPDQQDKYQRSGDNQADSATQIASAISQLRIPFHKNALPLFYP